MAIFFVCFFIVYRLKWFGNSEIVGVMLLLKYFAVIFKKRAQKGKQVIMAGE